MKRVVYLLRHAHVGREETFIGHLDIPLSSQGVQESQEWAQRMEDLELEARYCSDLLRATKTAEPLLAGLTLKPQLMAERRECNRGDGAGLRWGE